MKGTSDREHANVKMLVISQLKLIRKELLAWCRWPGLQQHVLSWIKELHA